MKIVVRNADCLAALRELPDCSVDAVVTDPPYGLSNTDPAHVIEALTAWAAGDREYVPAGRGFMGKSWDAFVPPPAVWDECLRVLRPGGHLLAFAGSRTHDLMTLSIRFAGFDVRDSIAWLYGSGFPKSLDVSKAIATRGGRPEDIRRAAMGASYVPSGRGRVNYDNGGASQMNGSTAPLPLTPDAAAWSGWGTALKPAFEPIVVARKPLPKGATVASNVLAHGTGALNIDACRVGTSDKLGGGAYSARSGVSSSLAPSGMNVVGAKAHGDYVQPSGRWPTNVALDGGAADELDAQSGVTKSVASAGPRGRRPGSFVDTAAGRGDPHPNGPEYTDSGGASRYFPTFRYQAKAPTRERPSYEREGSTDPSAAYGTRKRCAVCGRQEVNVPGSACVCVEPVWQADPGHASKVAHPTVKPLELMRWIVRLVTPPGGTVLEPFAGSGTTVEAAILEGFGVVAFEAERDYMPLIRQRVKRARGVVRTSAEAA